MDVTMTINKLRGLNDLDLLLALELVVAEIKGRGVDEFFRRRVNRIMYQEVQG